MEWMRAARHMASEGLCLSVSIRSRRHSLILCWNRFFESVYNLRIFSREAHAGRGCGIDGRYLVHKICQPHEFVIVAEVETEHGIVDGFVADVDFLCEGFFGEMQQCGTEVQLLVELVLKVKSEQSLTLVENMDWFSRVTLTLWPESIMLWLVMVTMPME